MNPQNMDVIHGGWWHSAVGVGLTIYNWAVGDASGLTIILTLLTILLTAIKIIDAVRRWNRTSGTVMQRVREMTQPSELGS